MEERLARRREFAEQYRLNKNTTADTIAAKRQQQEANLDLLVKSDKLTQDQKDEIMEEYQKDLIRLRDAHDEG